MGAVNQYYITMLVTNEQEHAIRSKFKEKKWPCHLTVLSSETVHGIIQNGFTDAFPSDNVDNVEYALYKEIKSEVVNLETEEIWNDDRSESLKRETPRNSDGHDDSDDEEEDSDDITDDNNDASEQTRSQFENYESEISKKTSKTKRLKVDRTAKVYKNTERRVKCSLCDVELASKSILKRHCQRIHPDDWFEFQCADCPSMFKTQSDHVVAMCKPEEKAEEHYEDDRPFKRFKSSADSSPIVEISQPDVATSEVSMSCVPQPDESKPDVVEPGVSDPGVLKPGVSKPDVSRSESSESENNERNTCKTTDWAVKILKDWITEVGYDGEGWEEWPAERLDSMLEKFYSSLRTQKGDHYSGSSLKGIRSGLNRYLGSHPFKRNVCLMRDKEFTKSNSYINKKIIMYKDEMEHRDPISDEDLAKLYDSSLFSVNKPKTLQNKVMFEVMMHFDVRGKEAIRALKKTDFKLKTDQNGCLFISMNENGKDHTPDGRDMVKSNRCMYEQGGGQSCPVASLMKYLSKLNPRCDALFQRPKRQPVSENDHVWYTEMPLGQNTLGTFMSRLSERADLSGRYTNHCIRATYFRNLQTIRAADSVYLAMNRQKSWHSLNSHGNP